MSAAATTRRMASPRGRSLPWSTTSRASGTKRAASCCQLRTTDSGHSTRCGPSRPARWASVVGVLPRPMSSARHPPRPSRSRNCSQPEAAALVRAQRGDELGGHLAVGERRLRQALEQVAQPAVGDVDARRTTAAGVDATVERNASGVVVGRRVQLGGQAQQAEDADRAVLGAVLADRLQRPAHVGTLEAHPPSADLHQRRAQLGGALQRGLVHVGVVDDEPPVEQRRGAEPAMALADGAGRRPHLRPAAGELLGDEHLDAGGAHVVEALEHHRRVLDVDRRVGLGERGDHAGQHRCQGAGCGVGRGRQRGEPGGSAGQLRGDGGRGRDIGDGAPARTVVGVDQLEVHRPVALGLVGQGESQPGDHHGPAIGALGDAIQRGGRGDELLVDGVAAHRSEVDEVRHAPGQRPCRTGRRRSGGAEVRPPARRPQHGTGGDVDEAVEHHVGERLRDARPHHRTRRHRPGPHRPRRPPVGRRRTPRRTPRASRPPGRGPGPVGWRSSVARWPATDVGRRPSAPAAPDRCGPAGSPCRGPQRTSAASRWPARPPCPS